MIPRPFVAALLVVAACAPACAPPPAASFPPPTTAEPAPTPVASPPPADPLVSMNREVRAIYKDAREAVLAGLPAVFVAGGGDVLLVRRGARDRIAFPMDVYEDVKAVDHVALGIHALLARPLAHDADDAPRPLERPREADALGDLRRAIDAAKGIPPRVGVSAGAAARARAILDRSGAFVDGVLAKGTIARADLVAYDRAVAPLLLANAEEAARVQLVGLHHAVEALRAKIPDADWPAARAVIMGPHMAREGHAVVQYFDALFGEAREEGGRVVYAEGIFDEKAALELVATHVLDGDVASGFFDDPLRMHRDLLSDAAATVVREIFPSSRASEPPSTKSPRR